VIKKVPFLGAIPLVQSIRESSDVGRPAALQVGTPVQKSLIDVTRNMVNQLLKRNINLPPTKAVEITNLVGCSAIK
jgi:ATP-binding protein involved in chromosome partitioning